MIASIHACVDLLHVSYRVKEDYDPIILNVYHCLKVEGLTMKNICYILILY